MPDTPPSSSESTEPRAPRASAAPEGKGDTPSVGSVLNFGEAGAYTLEERLGSGGYGEVYRARQVGAKGFSQTVAIKRLRRDSRPSHEQSFVDEARVLARLHHEHIAQVHGFFEHKGSQYLVMEYIEGQTLHALLKLARHKRYRFSEPMACEVMAEVADALNYAHEATDDAGQPLHIVHRDVSPVNILITKAGRVVLLDFGVARSKLDGRKASGEGAWFKGKVPYLSPEQVMKHSFDGRADLFAVGTILVEMLTGYAPFGSTADYPTLQRISQVTPEFIAALLPGVSPGLVAICQKLLARNPDQRFANGREVALALRRHAGLYEGPPFVQAEVAKLQVLPDGKPQPPAAEAPAPRKKKRDKRLLTLGGALAFACVFALGYAASRHLSAPVPASTSMEKPTMPMTKAPEPPAVAAAPAQKPEPPAMGGPKGADGAKAPAVPGASRAPSKRAPPANSCLAALTFAHVLALSACPAHVQTGTTAGDCYANPRHKVNGVEIPKEMQVEFVSLNGKKCTGPLDRMHRQTEPCPAEDGDIVVRIFPDPLRGPFLDIYDVEAPFAYGTARVVPVEGGENLRNPGDYERRDYVARLTAVFTQMKMHDGNIVPICGVLFDEVLRTPRKLNRDGIPVLDPKYYGTTSMPNWERATIRLFYPEQP